MAHDTASSPRRRRAGRAQLRRPEVRARGPWHRARPLDDRRARRRDTCRAAGPPTCAGSPPVASGSPAGWPPAGSTSCAGAAPAVRTAVRRL